MCHNGDFFLCEGDIRHIMEGLGYLVTTIFRDIICTELIENKGDYLNGNTKASACGEQSNAEEWF